MQAILEKPGHNDQEPIRSCLLEHFGAKQTDVRAQDKPRQRLESHSFYALFGPVHIRRYRRFLGLGTNVDGR